MKVKVFRFDPTRDKSSYFKEYEVRFPKGFNLTVLDVLDYISVNLDSSLSYYKHSVCNHGVCGRCLLKVNGKIKLACTTVVDQSDELVLEPKNKKKIVKDLVSR